MVFGKFEFCKLRGNCYIQAL